MTHWKRFKDEPPKESMYVWVTNGEDSWIHYYIADRPRFSNFLWTPVYIPDMPDPDQQYINDAIDKIEGEMQAILSPDQSLAVMNRALLKLIPPSTTIHEFNQIMDSILKSK